MKIQFSSEHARSAVVVDYGDGIADILNVAFLEGAYYPGSGTHTQKCYVVFLPGDPYPYVLPEADLRLKIEALENQQKEM